MLGRTGLFAEGFGSLGATAAGLEPTPIGDLPWLLSANTPDRGPPLPLAPLEAKREKWRKWLAAGEAIVEAMDEFSVVWDELRDAIADGDDKAIRAIVAASRKFRKEIVPS